jgi:hypothetical protein
MNGFILVAALCALTGTAIMSTAYAAVRSLTNRREESLFSPSKHVSINAPTNVARSGPLNTSPAASASSGALVQEVGTLGD